jgi:hypothetical protein
MNRFINFMCLIEFAGLELKEKYDIVLGYREYVPSLGCREYGPISLQCSEYDQILRYRKMAQVSLTRNC